MSQWWSPYGPVTTSKWRVLTVYGRVAALDPGAAASSSVASAATAAVAARCKRLRVIPLAPRAGSLGGDHCSRAGSAQPLAGDGYERVHAERLVARQRAIQLPGPGAQPKALALPGPGARQREVEASGGGGRALDPEVVRGLAEVGQP